MSNFFLSPTEPAEARKMSTDINDEAPQSQEQEVRVQPWKEWFIPEKPVSTDDGRERIILRFGDGHGSLPSPPRNIDLGRSKSSNTSDEQDMVGSRSL
ncbi:hypothetical protein CSIM01_02789 [Colletotrichum simmondsii]|uniref:Uncharacterized protein n=1 Tax=Colletotrichum simmondsii TaxID=703756 RepID=A0A135T1C4_9PEZI|nr:hypothetical protein CSIM01_02789 [Colletotrichum simmondsii]